MTENFSALAPPDSAAEIKAVINAFLQTRLQPKLDALKAEDDEKRQLLLQDHLPEIWIAAAADRVWQIEQSTHVLKYTHPDAKVSDFRKYTVNISSRGNAHAADHYIGTHSRDGATYPDAAGNAAAMDVYKFLSLKIGPLSLLDMACQNDSMLGTVFSDFGDIDANWMTVFAKFAILKKGSSSHRLAKQIFWPVAGKGNYHLLAPLFPTTLVHGVWKEIREDRFSDEAKAARQARRDDVAHPRGYREYPDLAIQKFGGTKPQNISQLNSERYGENFLLPSLPPTWKSAEVRAPLNASSVFDRLFGSRPRTRELIRLLREFLVSVEHAKTKLSIRNKRVELAGLIRDELFQYAAELQQLEPCWTQHPDCQLNLAERCWLDPERAETDADFASQRNRGDWQDEISRRFGNWLNARLTTANTPMDAVSAAHWRDLLDEEMRMMRLEVAEND